jgi:hypothetical protein
MDPAAKNSTAEGVVDLHVESSEEIWNEARPADGRLLREEAQVDSTEL